MKKCISYHKIFALGIIVKYIPPLYSAAKDMMQCAGSINAGFAWHAQRQSYS